MIPQETNVAVGDLIYELDLANAPKLPNSDVGRVAIDFSRCFSMDACYALVGKESELDAIGFWHARWKIRELLSSPQQQVA